MLEGIKVLDFTHIVAGPHCTKLMAEYGAEVLKIEPLTGDTVRTLPLHKDGRSGCFVQHNIGKKNLCMDLNTEAAKAICRSLVKQVDVVVENFSRGVMKRLGLDWETLRKINPELIMCSISCLGQTGPLAHLPGYDFIGQSYAGVIAMNGEPDQTPVFADLTFGDVSAGTHAYAAILSALFHRLRGGGGQYIDISLLDVLFSYHEMNVEIFDASSGTVEPRRSGKSHPFVAPAGIFQCGGRNIFILAIKAQWDALAHLIGRPDMLDDPRLQDLMGRGAHRREVDAAVQDWLDTIGDADIALKLLEQQRIPCAPILTIPEAMAHPHMQARGTVRTVVDPVFGTLKIPNTPFRFSQFPDSPDLRAGFMGECNREILAGWLGYADDQIDHLEAAGIIASKQI